MDRCTHRRTPLGTLLGGVALPLVALAACAPPRVAPVAVPVVAAQPERTVDTVLAEIGADVRMRLAPYLRRAGLGYPPRELALLAFKRERRLEIWGRDDDAWARIDAYPILAASGVAGPKLHEGDRQVPEGIYAVVALNPNSRFHLSMMLDYPNAEDLAAAALEGREDLGGEIFIHGGARSMGCLAMGDRAIENLFVLVADVGIEHVQVVIAPHDSRGGVALQAIPRLDFTRELYRRIADRLQAFRAAPAR